MQLIIMYETKIHTNINIMGQSIRILFGTRKSKTQCSRLSRYIKYIYIYIPHRLRKLMFEFLFSFKYY